jgi:hypothetical protein
MFGPNPCCLRFQLLPRTSRLMFAVNRLQFLTPETESLPISWHGRKATRRRLHGHNDPTQAKTLLRPNGVTHARVSTEAPKSTVNVSPVSTVTAEP